VELTKKELESIYGFAKKPLYYLINGKVERKTPSRIIFHIYEAETTSGWAKRYHVEFVFDKLRLPIDRVFRTREELIKSL